MWWISWKLKFADVLITRSNSKFDFISKNYTTDNFSRKILKKSTQGKKATAENKQSLEI